MTETGLLLPIRKVYTQMSGKSETKIDRRKEKRGPRQTYFFVAAIKDEKIIWRMVPASTKEEAEKGFKAETKLTASVVGDKRVYEVKDTGQQTNRNSVELTMDQIRYGENRWTAVVSGYNVIATGLKPVGEFKANELVSILVGEPVDPKAKTPKPRLGHTQALRFSSLENPQPLK